MFLILLIFLGVFSLLSTGVEFRRYLLFYYLGGIISSVASSIEVFWFFNHYHDGDQDFFINGAIDFFDNGVSIKDIEPNYFFYKLFVYAASPVNDYMIIAIFSKLSFSIIWGLSLSSLFQKSSYSNKDKVILLLLIFIGWYYSSFVLRDGFVAIGFLFFYGGFASEKKSLGFVLLGLLLFCFTRIHIPLLFLPGLFLFYIIKFIRVNWSPSLLLVAFFVLGAMIFKFSPLPKVAVAAMGIALLPDGESAQSALPFPRHELALTYVEGDGKARDTMIGFWVNRFPSIFYEPNPFRYFFWPFMGEFGKETFSQMFVKSLASLSSLLALCVFISTFFLDRRSYYSTLGGVYLFLSISLFFIGSIYAIKYFGMATRIYYGFLTGFLTLFFLKPVSNESLGRNFYPIFIALMSMSLLYFVLKPYQWIWSYL